MRNSSVKYLEFGPVIQEMSFKRFPPVWWSRTIYATLKLGIMGTNEIWTSVSGDVF